MRGTVPQHYVVEDGKLLAGEYPGSMDRELAVIRLRHLAASGVRIFIDLTSPDDLLDPYDSHLPDLGAEPGVVLRHLRFVIPDMGVPENPADMRAILDAISDAREHSPAAYVHCWGGIGRTGTVIGCWLRENGASPEEALERVQELYSTMPKSSYNPHSPQTPAQRAYVRDWQPGHGHPVRAEGFS